MLRSFLMILFLCFTTSLYACGMGENMDGYENVDVKHAHAHWQQGKNSAVDFVFLDVRRAEEYKAGHVQGALWIPVQELEQRISEVPDDVQLYVYCRSGVRSVTASNILVNAGFDKVENVLGGLVAWNKSGFPIFVE